MKKFLSTLVILALSSVSFARILPTSNTLAQSAPDAWSVYGGGCAQNATGSTITGCELAVDYNGNFVPTTTAAQNLGTALLQWSNIYAVSETITGNNSAGTVGTANALGTGNATAPAATTIVGGLVLQPSQVGAAPGGALGVYTSTTIPYLGTYEVLLSSGGNLLMSSVPTISTRTVPGTGSLWPTGTELVLTSTGTAVITLQSQGTLTNSGLRLGAATRAITVGNQLTLIFNATIGQWVESAFSAGTGN